MSDMKPTRWAYRPEQDDVIRYLPPNFCTYEHADGVRIAACLNACDGIDDPAALRRQRDELWTELEELVWVADRLRMGQMNQQFAARLDKARAAIRNATT